MNSVLGSLIDMIQVVLCQELIPSLDGKRVPLREWLVINDDMRREMLKAASQNVMTLPYVVGELVSKYGMTRLRNAELLAEKGLIDPMYVDKERLAQQKLVINNELISGNSGVNDEP
jgi:defect-in-organelle-trafficking protein DotB